MADTGTIPDEQKLLRDLETRLRDRLPLGWRTTIDPGNAQAFWAPDAFLTIQAPNGRAARLGIQVKPTFYPRNVYAISAELGGVRPGTFAKRRPTPDATSWLVLSRYLTPRTREMLRDAGFSYADGTGAVRIDVPDPPIFVELAGADKNPWPQERNLQSLRGAASIRVVRALIDFKPPYTLRDISSRAGLALGTASRVVNYLAEEALIERDGRGPILDVDWRGVIQRWAGEYAVLQSNRSSLYLEPRGAGAVLLHLDALEQRHAVTGSLAAARLAPVATPALAAVYVEDSSRAAVSLGLRPTPDGGNVVLLEPQSDVVFERTSQDQAGTTFAAPSQVAVDLLTSPGRGPSEGESLIEWMEDNETAWRRS